MLVHLVGVTKTEPLRELVWEPRKDPDYERKEIHHRAEDPHLREAEQAGATIVAVCQEHAISEQTFHRWKREFGMMELDQ